MIPIRIVQLIAERDLRFELIYEDSNNMWHALLKERRFNEAIYAGAGYNSEVAVTALIRVADGLPEGLRKEHG